MPRSSGSGLGVRMADNAALPPRYFCAETPLIDLITRDALLAEFAADAIGPDWHALLSTQWPLIARRAQLPPAGDWRIWLMLAGRGFGKTRSGAEWVDALARAHAGCRIALVGATIDDVRQVMVEGESGIARLTRADPPQYSPSLKRLMWRNGSLATCYSAAEPESLRGPQQHFAWADEVARWDNAGGRAVAAWDNLMLGLRLGALPRALATTTPRAVPLVRALLVHPGVVVTGGATAANAANLPPAFLAAMTASYGQSALARQELWGEMVEDVAGSLFSRAMLAAARGVVDADQIARVVIGVDPPASAHGDACGIIIAARLVGDDARYAVLADASVSAASPEKWARAVADAARDWRADLVVAEGNMGGDMVKSVLKIADPAMPVTLVHARRGKSLRAEPVALLYEQGAITHAGDFPMLEDQLCGLLSAGGYMGPGRSPDRADALVWAMHALRHGAGARPRMRRL